MKNPPDTGKLHLEARALLALGWTPSPDEPGRLYCLYADMPSAMTTVEVWLILREILDRRQELSEPVELRTKTGANCTGLVSRDRCTRT